jgi:hypothetical protein
MDYLVVLDIFHGLGQDTIQEERVETNDAFRGNEPAKSLFNGGAQSLIQG